MELKEARVPVRKTIKRNNVILKALSLPVIMNINPRSIYNKTDDFALLVDQYEADVICMSETWERPKVELKEILKLDNFEIISNVQQRDFQGGEASYSSQ